MLPKCSLIIYICINAFDYNAIVVNFTVLKLGTLYETWYYPSYLYGFRTIDHVKRYAPMNERMAS